MTDTNNYYPFGLNHIGGSNYSNFGSYYNYKYNGKELHETGMYDYGARMYMADLGRWGGMDAMAEKFSSLSPYNYALNSPGMIIDPDGNFAVSYSGEAAQEAFKAYRETMSISSETSSGNYFTGLGSNPFDDHFNQFGQFLYTDNKKTNNIIIDFQNPITRKLNTAPWLSVELKDYIFNKNNAFVLANIVKKLV